MNDTDATLVAAYARSWTQPDRARLPALVAEDTTLDYAALHERVAAPRVPCARRAWQRATSSPWRWSVRWSN